MNDKVREFWDSQANALGADSLATHPDKYARQLEIDRIVDWLPMTALQIIDIGCGNGWSTNEFFKSRPLCHFFGIDYSPAMIEAARATYDHLTFRTSDVRLLPAIEPSGWISGEVIISERCLINLPDWKSQADVLMRLHATLKDSGRLLLCENFADGLRNLNRVRAAFGLDEIKQRWHNRYMELDEFLPFVEKHFVIEHRENIGTPYFLVSRVIHAALAKMEGKEPAYDHPINELAAKLPVMGDHDYSANYLFVLRKK